MIASIFTAHDNRSTLLVAALSSGFGAVLLQGVSALETMMLVSEVGDRDSVRQMLFILVSVFFIIAVYVSGIVTANTVSTVIAGRVRSIALLRLIGASSGLLRRRIASEGLFAGMTGAVIGALVGTGLTFFILGVGIATSVIQPLPYKLLEPQSLVPALIVVFSTWFSSWIGSRRVAEVSPIEALGAAEERPMSEVGRNGRKATAIVLFTTGIALLIWGIVVGMEDVRGLPCCFIGGVVSFTGLVVGAIFLMPPVLATVGRAFSRNLASRLAVANALHHPERSARSAMALAIGVALVTTFAVALGTAQSMIFEVYGEDSFPILPIISSVVMVLVGFSGVIAATGMANALSSSVARRTRELGLLRALGLSSKHVRRMVVTESLHLTCASLAFGVPLGILYGWAGAQSLLGLRQHMTLVFPTIPWFFIAVAVFAVIAAVVPSRQAVQVEPIMALAVD